MAEEYDPTIVAPVLFQVPISALGTASRQELSSSLNDIKVILSPSDKYRDWRGVLSYMKLDRSCCDFEKEGGDYMSRLLSVWDSEGESASLGTLKEILGEIDRWDVVEDTARLFGNYNLTNFMRANRVRLKERFDDFTKKRKSQRNALRSEKFMENYTSVEDRNASHASWRSKTITYSHYRYQFTNTLLIVRRTLWAR